MSTIIILIPVGIEEWVQLYIVMAVEGKESLPELITVQECKDFG